MPYHFKGDAAHLAAAVRDNDAAGLVNATEVRRFVPYQRLRTLVTQASVAPAAHAEGILAKAEEARLALVVALDAADSMLAEARAGLGLGGGGPAT